MTREIIARRIGSRWSFSWQVYLTLVILGLMFSITWNPTEGLLGVIDAVGKELLADAIAALVPLFVAVTFLRGRGQQHFPVYAVVLLWAGIAGVRGIAMALLDPSEPARVLNSTVTLPMWALVVIYLFAAYDETRSRAFELGLAYSRLMAIQGDMQDLLAAERARLVDAVQAGIAAEISQLRQHITVVARPGSEGGIAALADRVATYSSDVVRETSHQLRRPDGALVGDPLRPGQAGVTKASFFSAYLNASQPIWVPMALIVSKAMSVWLLRWDWQPPRSQAIAFALMVVVMWCGRAIISRLVRRPSVVECAVSTALVLVTAGVVVAGFGLTRAGADNSNLIPLPTTGVFVIGIFIAARMWAAVQWRWSEISDELTTVNTRLAEVNSVLQVELAQTRERLADVLHGPVQGRLAAASMALRLYEDARTDGRDANYEATVAVAIELLDRALVDLSNLGRSPKPHWPDMHSGLAQVAAMWEGLVNVTWTVDDAGSRTPELVDGLVDIAGELVTNASRHADARAVRLTVRGVDEAWVEIVAVDDGRGPLGEVTIGNGLDSVRRFNGTWSIERQSDDTTRVTLRLRA